MADENDHTISSESEHESDAVMEVTGEDEAPAESSSTLSLDSLLDSTDQAAVAPSLLSQLRAPRPSDLTRPRKV